MNKAVYSFLNNCLDILPPYGSALDLRGRLARGFLRQSGERLRISSRVNIYEPGNVRVGNHVYIGYNTYLGAGEITLEDEVVIGPFCVLAAGNHTRQDRSFRYGPYEYGTITVGRGSWLGAHVTITAGVTIGPGCLIAAGSVVTEDVPADSVVGGVPGRVLKTLDDQ